MSILVTGATGQVGSAVCALLQRRGVDVLGVSSKELDIADAQAVFRLLQEIRPQGVIHCAAYTKVDMAEEEPRRCWQVNAEGTAHLAQACGQVEAKLLYLSTDYVFSGEGDAPHQTTDPVRPLSVYGASKLAGELAVQSLLKEYFIVRTSWVFGETGGNFLKTMLRLGQDKNTLSVVCDQIGAPTYTGDLAPLLCDLMETTRYGVYHAANEGSCSWAEFAREIFRQSGLGVTVNDIATPEYPAKAQRPGNSRLDKRSLTEAGISLLPPWQDAVARCLDRMANRPDFPTSTQR